MKVAAVLVFVAGLVSIFIGTSHSPVAVRVMGAVMSVAGTIVFIAAVQTMQIVNVEEDFLLAAFGDEYLQYKKKVCRYIGRKR